jgi:hypothetical protein
MLDTNKHGPSNLDVGHLECKVEANTSTDGPERPSIPTHRRTWFDAIERMRTEMSKHTLTSSELDTVADAIKEGVRLELAIRPAAHRLANTPSVRANHALVRKRLDDYMAIGAVDKLPNSAQPSMVQPLHVIIKADKKPRLVIDLSRNLNELIINTTVKYESLVDAVKMAHPGCWFAKTDLSNCFLSFPLHEQVQDLFVFRFDQRFYRFTHMPFGLASAPRICTQLLAVVSFAMTQAGVRHVRYLDDFLIIADSREQAQRS